MMLKDSTCRKILGGWLTTDNSSKSSLIHKSKFAQLTDTSTLTKCDNAVLWTLIISHYLTSENLEHYIEQLSTKLLNWFNVESLRRIK